MDPTAPSASLAPGTVPAGDPAAVRHATERLALGRSGDVPDDPLSVLVDVLPAIDRLQAVAVRAIQRAQVTGASETTWSMDIERYVRLFGRRTGGDARSLMVMADVLAAMPATQRLFEDGTLSAGEARALAYAARRRSRAELQALDDAVAANAHTFADLGADGVVGAVERLLARAREDLAEARERRAVEGRFVALQPALDGSGSLYAELPPLHFATVAAALDAGARAQLGKAGGDGDPPWRTYGRARADALEDLCSRWLAGEHTGRRARPSATVVIDVHTVGQLHDGDLWGQLLSPTARGTVQLTPRAVRRLLVEEDPTLRVVFTRDHEILGVTSPTQSVPEALKAALAARDGHTRDPGSTAPLGWADRHHVLARRSQGPTVLANLLPVTRGFHPNLEEDGTWSVTVEPDGTCRFTHQPTGHTVATLPRAHREIHPPSHPAYRPPGGHPGPSGGQDRDPDGSGRPALPRPTLWDRDAGPGRGPP